MWKIFKELWKFKLHREEPSIEPLQSKTLACFSNLLLLKQFYLHTKIHTVVRTVQWRELAFQVVV